MYFSKNSYAYCIDFANEVIHLTGDIDGLVQDYSNSIPLVMHWSNCSLGLGHPYYLSIFFWQDVGIYLGRAKTITSPFSISRIMYVLEWRNVSAPMRVLFGCLFPSLRSNEGNKHQNNTWVSTETVHHESTYIFLFLAWHNESINDDRHVELYRSSPCLTRLVFCSVDNVTIDCWWCHNDQTIVTQSRGEWYLTH